MPASNGNLTAAMEARFRDLRSIRASGGGTHERSHCPPPVNPLNAAGPSPRPRTSRHRTVRCEAAAEWQAETGPDSRGGCGGGQAGPRRRLAHRQQRPGEWLLGVVPAGRVRSRLRAGAATSSRLRQCGRSGPVRVSRTPQSRRQTLETVRFGPFRQERTW